MPPPPPDPGYGDPLAPVGSPEWAKRWRLEFQNVVKSLPSAPAVNLEFYQLGERYTAWKLVTDARGRPYPDFDSFCRDRQPWGLGMDPAKFRAYLKAEVGEKAADLVTVAPEPPMGPPEGSRNAAKNKSDTVSDLFPSRDCAAERKSERLRAVLRAPEVARGLYREGLLPQALAAKMGPRNPSPEKAAKVAEALEALETLDRSLPPREFRRQARDAVTAALGGPAAGALAALRRAWARASEEERAAFLEEVGVAAPA